MPTIYDVIVRQQLFLEGLKNNQHDILQADVAEIFKLYTDAIKALDVDHLGEMTNRALLALISERRALAFTVYSKYTLKFLKWLEDFTRVESNMDALTIKEVSQGLSRSVPLREFGKKYASKVWANIRNSTMPSTGDDFIKYIDNFGQSLITTIEKTIKFSAVNAETIKQFMERINGVPGKLLNKGGLLSRFFNSAKGMVNTTIQYVSSYVSAKVQSAFYDEYMWISIMDGHTTEVCIMRNGEIYIYGDGPIPPAHHNCRSRIVPIAGSLKKPYKTFRDWLTTQPNEIKQVANENELSLTLDQYRNKIGLILKDNNDAAAA